MSPVRWLLFLAVLVVFTVVLTGQWSQTSALLFMVLVGVSLAAGIVSATRSELVQNPVWLMQALAWITRHRAFISQESALQAAGLFIFSAYLFRPADLGRHMELATWLVVLGGLALGIAVRLQPRLKKDTLTPAIPTDSPSQSQAPFIVHRRAFALGVIGIFLLAEISGRALQIAFLSHISLHIQFLLMCVSAGLVVWGLSDSRPTRARSKYIWVDVLLLLLIVGVGFFLRFWGLETTIRTLVDEVPFSNGVIELWARGDIGLMKPMSNMFPFPRIYSYWIEQTTALFGRNFTGLRAASSILGTFNIVALYLLIRAFFDRKTALLGALLLMAFPPHIHFSRIALPHIADALFATLGFAFIGRGLRDNRRSDYALGGAGIAFSQYFFEAGRILFPPLTILWLAGVAFFWRDRLRKHRRGLITTLVVFVVLSVPFYYTLVALDYPLFGRFNVSGLDSSYWDSVFSQNDGKFTVKDQLTHFKAPWLLYVHEPESASTFYGGTEPLVMSVMVPLFLLGIFHAAWRIRSPGMLLLILWLLATSFGNSLLVDSAAPPRYVVIFPAMALFFALGIRYTLPLIWPRNWGGVIYRYAFVGGLLIPLAVIQIAYYFGPHLEVYQTQARPRRDIQDVVLRSVDFPSCTRIHVIAAPLDNGKYGYDMLRYFVDDMLLDVALPDSVNQDYMMQLQTGVDHAFYVVPGDTETIRKLREYLYLEGPSLSPYQMPPRKQYALYFAPHDKNPDTIGQVVPGSCPTG